uniref:type II toxin-antitoxin system RelE/ParE family toxin n=1 Tax=uncultured Sphingomonas sp. TaxID=158754 RepID=UPI0035CB849A
RWIARDHPARAATFLQELRQTCRDLLAFPQAYPIDPRYLPIEVRRRSHGRYIIFYRIGQDRLTIVGIVHSARDIGATLKQRLL